MELAGPLVQLHHFSVTDDSQDVFLVYVNELYHLSIAARKVRRLPVGFEVDALNITPDGSRLLITDLEDQLHVYDPESFRTLYAIGAP